METQLKPPTQPVRVSDDNAKRIAAFKNLIVSDICAPELHKILLSLYFKYTQVLVKHCDEPHSGAVDELYYLQTIIEILE